MKPHNIIQAIWPAFWLLGSVFSLFGVRDLRILPLIMALSIWLSGAISVHPARHWSWWACFIPLSLAALAGLGCVAAFLHMALFPDSAIWANANELGALAIIGTFLFLVPSSALLWHLFLIRRQFDATTPPHHLPS
jgi:hypothetical protein